MLNFDGSDCGGKAPKYNFQPSIEKTVEAQEKLLRSSSLQIKYCPPLVLQIAIGVEAIVPSLKTPFTSSFSTHFT